MEFLRVKTIVKDEDTGGYRLSIGILRIRSIVSATVEVVPVPAQKKLGIETFLYVDLSDGGPMTIIATLDELEAAIEMVAARG